jgi:hypothetical protein
MERDPDGYKEWPLVYRSLLIDLKRALNLHPKIFKIGQKLIKLVT